jgi:hypothetical protein
MTSKEEALRAGEDLWLMLDVLHKQNILGNTISSSMKDKLDSLRDYAKNSLIGELSQRAVDAKLLPCYQSGSGLNMTRKRCAELMSVEISGRGWRIIMEEA